jgi:hypothetical protein
VTKAPRRVIECRNRRDESFDVERERTPGPNVLEALNFRAREGSPARLWFQHPEGHALRPVRRVDEVAADGFPEGVADRREAILNGEMLTSRQNAETREELDVPLRRDRLLDLLFDPPLVTHLILQAAVPATFIDLQGRGCRSLHGGLLPVLFPQCPTGKEPSQPALPSTAPGSNPEVAL